MTAAFLELDVKMKVAQAATFGADTSGCTSVTAIVSPKYIICANARGLSLRDGHRWTGKGAFR